MLDAPQNKETRPTFWPYFAIFALLAAQLAMNIVWLKSVQYPFGAFHLSQSYELARMIDDRGIAVIFENLSKEMPLGSLNITFWALAQSIFGLSRNSVPITNTFWLLLCFLGVNSLARRITETNWAGPLACALMLAAPHIAFYSRVPYDEISMGALLVVMIWGLTASERFSKSLPLAAALASLAAGMLMKRSFAAYTIAPLIYSFTETLIFGYRRKRDGDGPFLTSRQIFLGTAGLISAAALMAWTFIHWSNFIPASAQTAAGGFVDQALWHLKQMYKHSLSRPLTTALVVCLPWLAAGKRIRESAHILASLLGAYLIITIFGEKDIRYANVLIPLCALSISAGLTIAGDMLGGMWKKAAAAVGIGMAVLGMWNIYDMSFRRNVIPLDSGYPSIESAECIDDFDNVFTTLKKHLRGDTEEKVVSLALHPFSPMNLSFHLDLAHYYVGLFNSQENESARVIGFEHQDYVDFPIRYQETDILLITQGVWSMRREHMEKIIQDMTDFNNTEAGPQPLGDADPQYRKLIEANFNKVETIPTKCSGDVYVYRKN